MQSQCSGLERDTVLTVHFNGYNIARAVSPL